MHLKFTTIYTYVQLPMLADIFLLFKSIAFIVATLLLNYIIHQFSTFSYLIFNIFFLINFPTYCSTLSNFSHLFTFSYLTTIYLNIIFLLSFIFLYFWFFLFPSFYYKFTIFYHILYIIFSHTKGYFSPFLFVNFFFFSFFGGYKILFFIASLL